MVLALDVAGVTNSLQVPVPNVFRTCKLDPGRELKGAGVLVAVAVTVMVTFGGDRTLALFPGTAASAGNKRWSFLRWRALRTPNRTAVLFEPYSNDITSCLLASHLPLFHYNITKGVSL